MSEATTFPAAIPVLSGETLPISIDFSLLITTGQTPGNPTATMYDITNGSPGTPVTQNGAVTINGNIVTKAGITGLSAGHVYRLVLGLTAATGIVWQAGVTINCPF